ncbi:hypothetical protein [Erwinia sp. JUb26]|uniref:hypothetical protein n=1 Tax=Erwinia sp. JUb26 TaxID=2485126 RepID=UPI000FACB25B|nr:hypothetical protein [Erwinia sp. JUb26]ROR11313.1 hypothetical protein EC836_103229 [Erwinia sp. JUb26]
MPFISKRKLELETEIKGRAKELREKSNLNDAIKCHYELLTKLYLTNPLYFKTLFKANRFIVGSAILGIYYTRSSSTFKDVRRFCIANDLFSSNALDSFLLFLRVSQRLEVFRDEDDRRKLNYKPTEKALNETRRMINTMLRPCSLLSADCDADFYLRQDDFIPRFFRNYGEITLNRLFIHDMVPGSGEFLSHDGGHMMMFNLFQESIKQGSLDVKYNLLKASFACCVSRSLIRRCLQAAASRQLLTIREDKNTVTLKPEFMTMVQDYFCIYLATVEYGLKGMD